MNDRLVTYREAADLLRVGESTLRRWVMNRTIPFVKISSRTLFDRDQLAEWVERHRVPARPIQGAQ